MKIRKYLALLLAICFTHLCYSQALVQSRNVKRISGKAYLLSNGSQFEIRENVVLAKLKEGKKHVRKGIKVIKSHSLGMLEIAVPDSIAIEKYITILDRTGEFDYVEFDTYSKPCMNANDAYYASQWGPKHINADIAWEITTGSPSVKVAVIDCGGFELNHPDLYYGSDSYANLSVSEGVDYVSPTNPTPTDYHGTMVTGVIGAKTNNSIGVAGIAGGNNSPGSKIVPYNASTISHCYSAISDAISKGVKVINISLSCSLSISLSLIINSAYNHGVTIVCASGNNYASQIAYPASHEHTIAVGSINSSDFKADYSNYGDGLDLVAPGENIISTATADEGYYKTSSGTSVSTPYVTGVVALMLSVNPNLTPDEIIYILRNTAKKINTSTYTYNSSGWNEYVGYGLVDACKAVVEAIKYSINGSSIICSSSTGTYTISGVPTTFPVYWYLSDGFGPSAPVVEAAGSTCTITNNISESYMGTLNADIYYLGTHIKSLHKQIITYGGFYGVYSSGSVTNQQFYPLTPIWVTKGELIHLQSPNLVYKNVSYSVTTPSTWSYYNFSGELYLSYPNVSSNNPIYITIQNDPNHPCCDNSYQIVIMPNSVHSHLTLNIAKNGDEQIVVSLVKGDCSDEAETILDEYADITKSAEWTLEVYNATSSKKVFSKIISGDSYNVNTTGWSSGVYIVKATYGNQVLNEKLIIK